MIETKKQKTEFQIPLLCDSQSLLDCPAQSLYRFPRAPSLKSHYPVRNDFACIFTQPEYFSFSGLPEGFSPIANQWREANFSRTKAIMQTKRIEKHSYIWSPFFCERLWVSLCARKECRLIRSAWYGDILSPGVGPSGFKSEALSPLGLMCIARAIGVPLSVSSESANIRNVPQ